VKAGSNATFTVMVAGLMPLSYQWQFNATNIASATEAAYTQFNVQSNDVGSYLVVITNALGSATSSLAGLALAGEQPVQLVITILSNRTARLEATGSPANYNVEATTNWREWTSLTNISTTTNQFEYMDEAANLRRRFYRTKQVP